MPGDARSAHLFNEELGAVLQVRARRPPTVHGGVGSGWAGRAVHGDRRASISGARLLMIVRTARQCLDEARIDLQRAWSETTYRMQQLRDNPDCAQQEYDRMLDAADPGLRRS